MQHCCIRPIGRFHLGRLRAVFFCAARKDELQFHVRSSVVQAPTTLFKKELSLVEDRLAGCESQVSQQGQLPKVGENRFNSEFDFIAHNSEKLPFINQQCTCSGDIDDQESGSDSNSVANTTSDPRQLLGADQAGR